MSSRAPSPIRLSVTEASNIDVLTSILKKVKLSGGDASNVVLPAPSRGRKGCKASIVCVGFGDASCKEGEGESPLQRTIETEKLFSTHVKSRCKRCQAAYARDYYRRNQGERSCKINDGKRRNYVRKKLIAQGAQVDQ